MVEICSSYNTKPGPQKLHKAKLNYFFIPQSIADIYFVIFTIRNEQEKKNYYL